MKNFLLLIASLTASLFLVSLAFGDQPKTNTATTTTLTTTNPVIVSESTKITTKEATTVNTSHITTDRPSFTTDSKTVESNHYQLELGYVYQDLDHGDANNIPNSSLRYGLDNNCELRLGWNGYSFRSVGDDVISGTDLGFKYRFMDQSKDPFSLAFIPTFTLPTGNADGVGYEFLFGWNYDINSNTSLSGNLGLGVPVDTETEDHFAQGIASLKLQRELDATNGVFGEYYTNFPAADNEDAEHVLQAGLVHRFNDNFQIDGIVGLGLNDQAPEWLLGVGFGYRF